MTVLDIRQRTGWLFLALTVGHVILISAQVTTRQGVPVLEAVVFGAFAEVQRAATTGIASVRRTWANYVALQDVREENARILREVTALRVEIQQERALAQQARGLAQLLELRQSVQLETTGATVIAGGTSPDFRTMTIDKGSRDGVGPDMAVVAPDGVVGRVILPSGRAAKVQLLIDRNAAAGALVERSRVQGIVTGTGTERLRLDYVRGTADVRAGDRVVTSGIDGIYPKGFVIGQIESVQRGAGDYSAITVEPAVEFSSLEAVLVVLTRPDREEADAPLASGLGPRNGEQGGQ